MRTYQQLMLWGGLSLLAACNPSDSNDIQTEKLILTATLYADGSTAKIKAALGKEKSTVVVVLNGGDYLQVSDGKTTSILEFQDSLINNINYRQTLPLNLLNSYSISLNRPTQNTVFSSTFPVIPDSFAIVFPINLQTISATSQPILNVQWDNKVNSEKLTLTHDYQCTWTANPAVINEEKITVNQLNSNSHHMLELDTIQRSQRTASLSLNNEINDMKSTLITRYPTTTLTLNQCSLNIELAAKNSTQAHSEFSNQSRLYSVREYPINITLTP